MTKRIANWRVWAVFVALLAVSAAVPATWADEVIDRARALADEGKFGEAEQLLRGQIADPDAPVADAYAVELEILRRIRRDYRVTPAELLTQLRRWVPDVSEADVEAWRKGGVLQHRVIDGQVCYFGSAARNLFRFSASARKRRVASTPPPAGGFDKAQFAAKLLKEADAKDDALVHPVRQHVTYTLRVKDGNPHVQKGAKVRCWLPFPQQYRQQQGVRLIRTEPEGGQVAPVDTPQRTVYFEQTIEDADRPVEFTAEFEFVTYAMVPKLDPAQVKPYDESSNVYGEYVVERRPHIVFTPEIQRLAERIVGDETNPLLKARRIFRWVSDNIPWSSEREYSTIRNLSMKGLSARTGDCGVQGMLFVTLCRAAEVPARWQSGWQTTPGRWNMHDWSEFYVEPWGWLPADASYGVQDHPDVRVQEFFCGHMDPYRMIVNLDYGRELVPPKTSFRSEPYDFQRGEIEIDGHNLYYDEWSWTFDPQTEPVKGGMAALEETFDAEVPDALSEGDIPGAVLLVGRRTKDGKFEVWKKAYGYAQVEPTYVPMRDDALFDLASMTKPIATGTSMMVLVEQGKVGLDEPVGRYMPEFVNAKKGDITVRHLMTHMSGLKPYVGAAEQTKIKEKAGFPCRDATAKYIRELDLDRRPGEAVVYSCLNAILCGQIIEKVTGEKLDAFATEHVFGPLGMKDTGFNPPAELRARCLPTTRAKRGTGEGGFLQGQVHDPLAAMLAGVSGNAGLFSTADDLSRFAQMMLSGGELDGVRVLSPESVAAMTRVQNPGAKNRHGEPDRRGLLWDLYGEETDDGRTEAYGHTGYTGGAIRVWPERGVYAIALTNRVHPDDGGKVSAFREMVWKVVGRVQGSGFRVQEEGE